jgi:hypothetical protein
MKLSPVFMHEAKALLAYVAILAVFLYAVDVIVGGLKTDINTAVRTECVASQPQTAAIFRKYNDLADSLVQHERSSEKQDLKRGRNPEAANDAALVARLKSDEIQQAKQDCSKPFLP